MNVKVVSGSAAGFHINTVTYRESRSFFFTWRVAHGLSSVVKMLADSVRIITRTFSSNNDLCCFKTEQLLCPSLKGIPWRFPQNKKKKSFFSSKQTVRVLHSQQTHWMLFHSLEKETEKSTLKATKHNFLDKDEGGWRVSSPGRQILTFWVGARIEMPAQRINSWLLLLLLLHLYIYVC